MAAKDKNGQDFAEGQRVHVVSDGKAHPGGDNPKGDYEGDVLGVHEDGPHVVNDEGVRSTPYAADCEIVPRKPEAKKAEPKAPEPKGKKDKADPS